jgi:hypothetical protein
MFGTLTPTIADIALVPLAWEAGEQGKVGMDSKTEIYVKERLSDLV